MSDEQLISELEKNFKIEDQYLFLDYISKNKAIFISAISIISAIVIFTARSISFLVVIAKYRFWNLDESFIVEDDKAFLKLGVYVLFFLLITLLNFMAKRYLYRWELYNFEIYLFDKIITNNFKQLKKVKKEIAQSKKSVVTVKNGTNSQKEVLLNKLIQLKSECVEIRKRCTAIKKGVWKIRISLLARFLLLMLAVFVACILLQLFLGTEKWDNGIVSLVVSTAIMTLLIVFTALFCAFCETKLIIKNTLKQSFSNKKIEWGSDSISQVIDWLKAKISEQEKQSIKIFFSDKSLKILLISVITTTVFMTIHLQFYMNYSLKRMDSFYVFREDHQYYVMLINDGNKYIFSECDINDTELIIDTNKIIVRNNPVNLEKKQFKSVERKQLFETSDMKGLQHNEES